MGDDVYTTEGINTLMEDEEISPEEQGFMIGYLAEEVN